MRKILALIATLFLTAPALAGSGTVAYTPCASGCTTFQTTTNASTNNIGNVTLWDSAAGANGLGITTNNAAKVEGVGSAGTATGGILTVQGAASMTPLSANVFMGGAAVSSGAPLQVTGANGTFPASQSGTWNITNISGTVSLPTGAATSANQSTEITSLATIATNTGAAVPAGTNVIGFTSNDACSQLAKSGASINLTASGQIITGTSGKKTYICSIDLFTAAAQNIALVEGTGSTCATNIFGLAGGTTAATGWSLPATGGLTKGAGIGTVYSPSADANATAANVCLLLSGSGQTSGQITYVQN